MIKNSQGETSHGVNCLAVSSIYLSHWTIKNGKGETSHKVNRLAISLTSAIPREDESFATEDYSTTINNLIEISNISEITWLSIHQAATLRFYREKHHGTACEIISIAHGLQR